MLGIGFTAMMLDGQWPIHGFAWVKLAQGCRISGLPATKGRLAV
jgi:hypothetical protein